MKLTVISNFTFEVLTGESNSGPFDPKLNALNHSATDPRSTIHCHPQTFRLLKNGLIALPFLVSQGNRTWDLSILSSTPLTTRPTDPLYYSNVLVVTSLYGNLDIITEIHVIQTHYCYRDHKMIFDPHFISLCNACKIIGEGGGAFEIEITLFIFVVICKVCLRCR